MIGYTANLAVQGGVKSADGKAADCVINALLCRIFSQPEYTAMFRDFYLEDRFPACLLRSPEGWSPTQRTVPLPEALWRTWPGVIAARSVSRCLYSGRVMRRSTPSCRTLALNLSGIPLLGDTPTRQGGWRCGGHCLCRGGR